MTENSRTHIRNLYASLKVLHDAVAKAALTCNLNDALIINAALAGSLETMAAHVQWLLGPRE